MRILRSTKVKIFLTILSVYLFYIAPEYLSSNVTRHIDLAKAIVDDKTFAIDKYHENTRDKAFYNGHYYVGGAPGLSFAAAPIYIALKPFLKFLHKSPYGDLELNILNIFFTFFLAILPGAFTAVLLYDMIGEFGLREKERKLIGFTLSFGTIIFYYSTRFVFHTMAVFMLFSAFYILFKSRNKTDARKDLYFLAGLCLGGAIFTEYTLTIGMLLLVIYAFSNFNKDKIPHYIFFALGASLVGVISMYYHYKCFGSPFVFASRYSPMLGPVPLAFPKPEILFQLSFGTYRGLFIFMPILFLSLYGGITFFKRPDKEYLREMIFVFLYSASTFFIFAMACNPVWPLGGDFGPRNLIGLVPFLMIPAAFAFKKLNYRIILWISAVSIFINWCGVQYGDADNAFTDVGLFILMGLNSSLAEWGYKLVNTYIRQFNVVTHFSPLIGFIVLLFVIYLIWKGELRWKTLKQ